MAELEFSKKPRRMTDPPQNRRRWLPGYSGIQVKMETDPVRMAYFAREATWGDLMMEPTDEELRDTLEEVAGGKVLGAAFKGGVGFRIRASRSTMDQMLRLAEGSGGAGSGAGAQTTRDNDMRDFNVIIPRTISNLIQGPIDDMGTPAPSESVYQMVVDLVEKQREVYGALVDSGVPPQDARYVALPLGFQTQWFHVMSLGNMIKMCGQRLCNGLTQHETNYLVRAMRDLVVAKWPHMDGLLRSDCEKRGQCASRTMLFPPCGAFTRALAEDEERTAAEIGEEWSDAEVSKREEAFRLHISQYKPSQHLYAAEQNDAMEFAKWDIDRQKMERDEPDAIFCMAGPPRFLCYKTGR